MKAELKTVSEVKRQFLIAVSKEKVNATYKDVYKEIGQQVKVKGFRKGKVPQNIIASQYGDMAREEVIKKLVPDAYMAAVKDHDVNPLDYPQINAVEISDERELTFQADFEVKPEIKLKKYKGIKVKPKPLEVKDKDIDDALDYLKKGQGKAEDVVVDDAFARGMGYANLDALKTSIRRQMEVDTERQIRDDVSNQIKDELIKQTKFDIPESLKSRQKEYMINQLQNNLKSSGMPEAEMSEKIKELEGKIEEDAVREVKVFLILSEIFELEKLELNDKESVITKVMEFLLQEADWK